MRKTLWGCLAAILTAGPVAADDLALVVGNIFYRNASDLRQGDAVFNAAQALSRAGVQTYAARNADTADLAALTQALTSSARGSDGVAVVLSGRFVQSATESFFLPVDAAAPELAGIGGYALALSTVLAVLAEHPGEAVLLLATTEAGQPSGYLSPGVRLGDIPQGVSVIVTDPGRAGTIVRDVLARPGASLSDAVKLAGVSGAGYLPEGHSFLDAAPVAPPAETTTPSRRPNSPEERESWRVARLKNTPQSYRAYLASYPNGWYAAEAQELLAQLNDPQLAAERAEAALGLDAEARRQIQRNLSLLDYDTRGIDGIFGPGTRAAIGAWQTRSGFAATGYVTGDQLNRLTAQAETRAAELEAEAARRRAEEERQDRAYWRETGAKGGEGPLRAYLEKYPDGLFAAEAQQALDAILEEQRRSAAAADRQAFDTAREKNTIAAYRKYLREFPDGAFAGVANLRLAQLIRDRGNSGEIQAARAVEERMGLVPITRRLIESQLAAKGFEPGSVDGVFDDQTRRAIRRFQRGAGLAVTGYLNQVSVVRIMAGK